MRVEFVSRASAEFLSALRFYESEGLNLAARLLDDVERAVALIADFPSVGSPAPADTRRVHLRRFPYSLIYRCGSDVIWVVAMQHHRQKPDTWIDRG